MENDKAIIESIERDEWSFAQNKDKLINSLRSTARNQKLYET